MHVPQVVRPPGCRDATGDKPRMDKVEGSRLGEVHALVEVGDLVSVSSGCVQLMGPEGPSRVSYPTVRSSTR